MSRLIDADLPTYPEKQPLRSFFGCTAESNDFPTLQIRRRDSERRRRRKKMGNLKHAETQASAGRILTGGKPASPLSGQGPDSRTSRMHEVCQKTSPIHFRVSKQPYIMG